MTHAFLTAVELRTTPSLRPVGGTKTCLCGTCRPPKSLRTFELGVTYCVHSAGLLTFAQVCTLL
uniref:Uncharacterized protein n=1 Tax=Hyaloperonospora arabidopsidis (strain Emoy2) TaxID=559515 RepID=M4BR50_HYAAE